MSDRIDVDKLREEVRKQIVPDRQIQYQIWLAILDTLVDIKRELVELRNASS